MEASNYEKLKDSINSLEISDKIKLETKNYEEKFSKNFQFKSENLDNEFKACNYNNLLAEEAPIQKIFTEYLTNLQNIEKEFTFESLAEDALKKCEQLKKDKGENGYKPG